MRLFTALIGTLLCCSLAWSAPAKKKTTPAPSVSGCQCGIAVVKGRYDDVELVLQTYRLPYDLLELGDLEDPDRVARYRSMFVPSGVDYAIETNIEVMARSTRIESVALKSKYREVDHEHIAKTIRSFVKGGGALYVSGFSFRYLQDAFEPFTFHKPFPFMGMPARIEANISGDLSRFAMKRTMAIYQDHPGWVAIRSVSGAEVLAEGEYETARGMRSGPLSVIMRRGSGEIVYTSYDSTVLSDFRRFNVYRVAAFPLLDGLETTVRSWGQDITCRVVDALHGDESSRIYRMDLGGRGGTIYLHSTTDVFQVDILDANMATVESRDLRDREQVFHVPLAVKDRCYVKIYPSTERRYGTYAIVAARGMRVFPYFWRIVMVLLIIGALAALVVVKNTFFGKRYSGRLGF